MIMSSNWSVHNLQQIHAPKHIDPFCFSGILIGFVEQFFTDWSTYSNKPVPKQKLNEEIKKKRPSMLPTMTVLTALYLPRANQCARAPTTTTYRNKKEMIGNIKNKFILLSLQQNWCLNSNNILYISNQ